MAEARSLEENPKRFWSETTYQSQQKQNYRATRLAS